MLYKNLIKGTFLKRYKRFLVDVRLETGEIVTAHCTNSGSLKSAIETNAPVRLSLSDNPKRKTRFTWEMIKINGSWVGVNTSVANILAYEFITQQKIPHFPKYDIVKREVKYHDSRLDIYAENNSQKTFVEVKNVTLKQGEFAMFPDAKTTRGQKHLQTLIKAKNEGYRAVMLYIVQRIDVEIFAPASEIDPIYADMLKQAYNSGVEIIPVQVLVCPKFIDFVRVMPFSL